MCSRLIRHWILRFRDVEGGLASWLEEFSCDISFEICDNDYYIECRDNHYYIQKVCSDEPVNNVCVDFVGCAACKPKTTFCDDNQVFECSADGMEKKLLRKCSGECQDGQCIGEDNCNEESKFIYLVDPTYNLIKFNPGDETKQYETLLFKLNCYSESTPFSMAVDRNAVAWVLYYDASIYKVDIATQQCTFVKKLQSNQLGGMGFCSDEPGSEKETLYMAERGSGHFAKINPETLEYTELAPFPDFYEQSPELTGTGLAKLIAFAPGDGKQFISEIDKDTGKVLVEYQLPGVPTASYAVAHWGGYYFTFLGNRIYRFDPKTEEFITFLSNAPFQVIGAGVSTCAPVETIN